MDGCEESILRPCTSYVGRGKGLYSDCCSRRDPLASDVLFEKKNNISEESSISRTTKIGQFSIEQKI